MTKRPPENDRRQFGPVLRRADQAAVAALVVVALAASLAWWVRHGGLQNRLIEIDQADRRDVQFSVDINTADWPELAQLPGIGETLARRIVGSRQADGLFTSIDDLRRIRGIGPKTVERVRPFVLPPEEVAKQ